MVRLNRIYTKAGDGGRPRLVGGQKVRKDALRIEAYGTIDECLGLPRAGAHRAGSRPPRPPAPTRWQRCCAHPERAVQPGQRSGHAARGSPPPAARGRSAPRHRARTRDRWLERIAAGAAQLRPAGRRRRRGVSAPGAHRLPPRRAAGCPPARRRADRRAGPALPQSPVRRAVRHEPPRRRASTASPSRCGNPRRPRSRDAPQPAPEARKRQPEVQVDVERELGEAE